MGAKIAPTGVTQPVSFPYRNTERESATDSHGFTQINTFRRSSAVEGRMHIPLNIELRIAEIEKQTDRQTRRLEIV